MPTRDDHEGKKSADGDQAARFPNGEPAGGNRDGEAGHDRSDPGVWNLGCTLLTHSGAARRAPCV